MRKRRAAYSAFLTRLMEAVLDAAEAKRQAEKVTEEKRQLQERILELKKTRERIAKYNGCISIGGDYTVGLKADGTVVAVGNNKDGQCNVSGWRDIVAVFTGAHYTVGLKADGTVVAVGKNTTFDFGLHKEVPSRQCDVSGWRDIGPVSEEHRIAGARRLAEERQQSERWEEQGLCRHCGGKMGGLFTKKCKSCGKEK
jgi:hypothetical protein